MISSYDHWNLLPPRLNGSLVFSHFKPDGITLETIISMGVEITCGSRKEECAY